MKNNISYVITGFLLCTNLTHMTSPLTPASEKLKSIEVFRNKRTLHNPWTVSSSSSNNPNIRRKEDVYSTVKFLKDKNKSSKKLKVPANSEFFIIVETGQGVPFISMIPSGRIQSKAFIFLDPRGQATIETDRRKVVR